MPTPPTSTPSLSPRLRRTVGTALQVGTGAGVTLAINVVVLLIAVPIGILADEPLWSIAIAEGTLLLVSLGFGISLAVRRRRGLGAGVVLGWVAGYVGLLTLVVMIMAIAVVAFLCLIALMLASYAIGGL